MLPLIMVTGGGHKNSKSKKRKISVLLPTKAIICLLVPIRETDKIAIGKVVLKDREPLLHYGHIKKA